MPSRRQFFKWAAAAAVAAAGPAPALAPPLLKPPRLRPGATVGLVSPGGAISDVWEALQVRDVMAEMGLRTRVGRHAFSRRGYLAGTDAERADDLNRMFADQEVDAILALRGGWGAARLLPLLDYDLIRAHPKILVGYSDVTALLLALYARTGLVTFHGPVGISTWNPFTLSYFRRILFDGEAARLEAPAGWAGAAGVITPGVARGRLAGGNLSVLAGLVGSDYLPPWDAHVLFLEDIGESVYRIDRMLTHLKLAGVLAPLAGLVFGDCTDCEPEGLRSLSLEEVYADHIRPLGIPAWHGAPIGHIRDKVTVPVGLLAEIDAVAGAITLLEPAVV